PSSLGLALVQPVDSNVSREEYLDVSDRAYSNASHSSGDVAAHRTYSSLLCASIGGCRHTFLARTSRALWHPFTLTRFTANMDTHSGGFKRAMEPALIVAADHRMHRPSEVSHQATTNNSPQIEKASITPWERDLLAHSGMSPESFDYLLPSLAL